MMQPTTRTAGTALVMGICNVTPDSFSDGGAFFDPDAAIAHGRQLFDEGCSVVDVGGESTRPGAEPVAEDEELRRVLPVVTALAQHGMVSIDTTKEAVARAAVVAGATMINDVRGDLAALAGELGVAYVAMHARGNPETMQEQTTYDDLLGEVTTVLLDRCRTAKDHGATAVYGDPGIGFAKTFDQNRYLLAHLRELATALSAEGFGLLVGVSRKGFLSEGASGQRYPVVERGDQSLAASVWAMANGAAMVRVHDGLHTVRAAVLVGEVGTI